MRFFYLLVISLFTCVTTNAQTIDLSGQCITGTITLNRIADLNDKPVYEGIGTVSGFEGLDVYIYWTEDNVWVVAFSGQPHFQNACNTLIPPGTGSQSCPWTAVPETECPGEMPLTITGSGALPVRLTGFTASGTNKMVQLNWKTAFETNNKGFEVQRSKNGIDWVKIGFVNGAVNSSAEKSYQFIDGAPLSGKNYYMLNQLDVDGRRTPSSIVQANLSNNDFYKVANNPGNGIYQLNIQSAERVEISVLDLAGRKLFTRIAAQGVHRLDLSKYANGIYLLQLRKDNKVVTEKLIKSK